MAVAPPRSSLARERRNPSTPWRAAATAGASSAVEVREIVTTRPPGASRRSTAASAATGAARSSGCSTSDRTRTTAFTVSVVATCRWTSRSHPGVSAVPPVPPVPARSCASASASGCGVLAPSWPPRPITSTGPSTSGSPARWRRSGAGRGRPSCFASFLVNPELTRCRYVSVMPPPGSR
ncbi:hypothetical protein GALL_498250 [mine drainage metagenome]|uniref:Uncharacterized protein n=1 Tax=mine drainage metagenome TaxID=410659 RepID=A0A1J5PY76_9ZZZZ